MARLELEASPLQTLADWYERQQQLRAAGDPSASSWAPLATPAPALAWWERQMRASGDPGFSPMPGLAAPAALAAVRGTTPQALALLRSVLPPKVFAALERAPANIVVTEPATALRHSGQELAGLYLPPAPPALAAELGRLGIKPGEHAIIPALKGGVDPRAMAHESLHALYQISRGAPEPPMALPMALMLETPGVLRFAPPGTDLRHRALDLLARRIVERAGLPFRSLYGEPARAGALQLQLPLVP
jgi:hypothetical protein